MEEKKRDRDEEKELADEHEKELFKDTEGFFEVAQEEEINETDQQLLKKMQNNPKKEVLLCDLIMQKMENPDEAEEDEFGQQRTASGVKISAKLIEAYKSLGTILRQYKSGKLPKLFKILPNISNWEEVVVYSNPSSWSPAANEEATKMFVSQLNVKLVQRFINMQLLPSVRENIENFGKLNYHLYMALKKCFFKSPAFFKGFLLPLA